MNTERFRGVERRAAVHAALGDPSRLLIVDTLLLGDRAPSELSALLGMPSNLLAHHLKVLQGEGILSRVRSEGDRRRCYLRLQPDALDAATPGAAAGVRAVVAARRVLFVCTANSARSHLAAALWRRASPVPVASAGTHPAAQIDPGALAVARRHRLALRRIRPRQLDEVYLDGDLIITVCDLAHEALHDLPDLHWSIPDPVRLGHDAAFDDALGELARRVENLAPRLQPLAAT
jgi:protein-tyrosine-phosphatase/DNA-binding HxlR family transcriptional regulator